MARYTKLQRKDVQEIIRFYGLTIKNFKAIEGGAENSSYLLRSEHGSYILTVFNGKEWTDVIRLGKLLNHLDENKFKTTKLVPRVDGKCVTEFQHMPVMIKSYIRGKIHENLTEVMLRQTGEALARLHEIPPPDYLPLTHPYGRQLFSKVIGKGIDLDYESWLANKQRYLKEQLPKSLPRGLIHGDLFHDNILFKGNELQAIIDFEDACNYYLVFDIGMGILGQCTDGITVSLEKAKEFVAGYQQVRPLEKMGRENLQIFVEYAAIATSYWRFWYYHIYLPTPDKQQEHRIMMRIADKVSAIPAIDFQRALFGSH